MVCRYNLQYSSNKISKQRFAAGIIMLYSAKPNPPTTDHTKQSLLTEIIASVATAPLQRPVV